MTQERAAFGFVCANVRANVWVSLLLLLFAIFELDLDTITQFGAKEVIVV